LRKALTTGDPKKDSKIYLLDAASNLGIKLTDSSSGSCSLSYCMTRLNDKDLNHAFDLKLFSLTDACLIKHTYFKFDFFW